MMESLVEQPLVELQQSVAERTRELATLNTIARTVSRSLDLETLLPTALNKVLEVLDFESGAMYLKDLETGELQMACSLGLSDEFRCVAAKGMISAKVAESNNCVIIDDLQHEPGAPKPVVEEGYRSVASIPLLSKEQVQGVLTVSSRTRRLFRKQDTDLLLSIGHQIGVAVESARLFEVQRKQAEQFRLISEVGRNIITILDVDQLLGEIARHVGEILGYYLVGIGLIEEDEVVMTTGVGPYWEIYAQQPLRLKVGQGSIVGWVAGAGEPLMVPDVSTEPRYFEVPQITETRSELAVPLRTKNQVIGVLDVQSKRLDAFDENDVVVLESLANQAAMAIENAQLFGMEQRRAGQFGVISEVGRHITSILDVDQLLERIVHLVRDSFGYYLVGIGLNEGDVMITKTGAGPAWDDPEFQPPRLKVGEEGIMGWVAGMGEHMLVRDVSQEPRYVFTPQTVNTRSELCVPLTTKAGVIGVLDVQSDQLDAFDPCDVVVLQSLAHQAAIAIDNARLYKQAQQLAALEERERLGRELHDAVTQTLFSASLIAEVLPRLWERDQNEGRRRLDELGRLTRGALAEMRTLLLELRPGALAEGSLADLLRQLAEATTGRVLVPVQVMVEGECSLPPDVQVALYRIAQEALNNVARHSGGSQALLKLHCQGEQVELIVTDQGYGFDVERLSTDGMGLSIMRERAEDIGAAFSIHSQPGKGTKISVVWPDPQRKGPQ
jgi:signal transduction histidine kinase